MLELSAERRDVIAELANIGMGKAGAVLGQMTANEVQLSIPLVGLRSREDLVSEYQTGSLEPIVAINQSCQGAVTAEAFLLFPECGSLELARALLDDPVSLDEMSEIERETLSEVGNVILNSFLGSFANVLGEEIATSIPRFLQGSVSDVLGTPDGSPEQATVLYLRVEFEVMGTSASGNVALVFDLPAVTRFVERIDALLTAG